MPRLRLIPLLAVIFISFVVLVKSEIARMPDPPPESPEAFLRRMKPLLAHEALEENVHTQLKHLRFKSIGAGSMLLPEIIADFNQQLRIHNLRHGTAIPFLRESEEFKKINPPSKDSEHIPKGVFYIRSATPEKEMSAEDLLNYIAFFNGANLEIEPDAIWLKPMAFGIFSNFVRRSYVLPRSLFKSRQQVARTMDSFIPDLSPELKKSSRLAFDWSFDEKANVFHLKTRYVNVPYFELRYAHQLLKLGYKIPKG